ncbi:MULTISPECIES: LCP family protein [unclassified Microbacterium]|uniref:LCP family protein n=1 Tax=unclassified Microbacterium TaxID=2609290 RepID=UPI00214B6A2E|nr:MULTISPECIES: LCP family protein [unclassified Microbacterium]MCR2783509.1 LCP family protein [Microbacterium sp. zg.B96]WIM15629.1 LCP family protein [Microbacterium sp. zg-B96]
MSATPDRSGAPTGADRAGRRPLARHGTQRTPGPWVQLMKFLAIGLAVVLVSGVSVAAYAAFNLASSFADGSVDLEGQEAVPPDIGEIEGGVNLFLAGTDACEPEYAAYFGDRCTGSDATGELNDVNMLVHISDNPRRVTVVSFPRDLMVPIPACTDPGGNETPAMRKQPLNSAYSNGGEAGLACVVSTISELSGQEIPFAAKITWGGVIEITNAIGGVEVCIENGIKDPHTGIDWEAGNRTIAGVEALQFLRTRYGVGNGGDLGRISNQQQYMSRLARKLVSDEVLSNPATLYSLASTAVENVTPSKTLTNPVTLMQIALAVKNVPFEEIVFLQYPVLEDPDDPNKVVPDYDAADQLWAALEANQPLIISGETSQGDGVVVVEPETPAAPAPTEAAPAPGETAAPSETPAPGVTLPSSIAGQTAAQETCTNGNVSQ